MVALAKLRRWREPKCSTTPAGLGDAFARHPGVYCADGHHPSDGGLWAEHIERRFGMRWDGRRASTRSWPNGDFPGRLQVPADGVAIRW